MALGGKIDCFCPLSIEASYRKKAGPSRLSLEEDVGRQRAYFFFVDSKVFKSIMPTPFLFGLEISRAEAISVLVLFTARAQTRYTSAWVGAGFPAGLYSS